MAVKLNSKAVTFALDLVRRGKYNVDKSWELTGADTDALLEDAGGDWGKYSRWFLGIDDQANPETKGAYKYAHGKAGEVYKRAVVAAKARASQQDLPQIVEAASKILDAIKEAEDKAAPAVERVAWEEWRKAPAAGVVVVGAGFGGGAVRAADGGDASGLDVGALRAGGSMSFVVSTETVDRYGDVVRVDGWELGPFQRNPVVLWGHMHSVPPVGRAVEIGPDGKKLVSTAEFPPAELSEFGNEVYRLLAAGFLNATSVGFMPLEWKENAEGYEFLKQELWEYSVVSVPANPDAVAERTAGDPVARALVMRYLSRLLDVAGRVLGGEAGLAGAKELALALAGNPRSVVVPGAGPAEPAAEPGGEPGERASAEGADGPAVVTAGLEPADRFPRLVVDKAWLRLLAEGDVTELVLRVRGEGQPVMMVEPDGSTVLKQKFRVVAREDGTGPDEGTPLPDEGATRTPDLPTLEDNVPAADGLPMAVEPSGPVEQDAEPADDEVILRIVERTDDLVSFELEDVKRAVQEVAAAVAVSRGRLVDPVD